MREIFADTFYFLALNNPADRAHHVAAAALLDKSTTLVTGAWVLTEVGDALAAPWNRGQFAELLDTLAADDRAVVLGTSQELFLAGVELYRVRGDKGWSVTDCMSFVMMKRRGITEALTGDRHFEQAGFRALLR